MGRVSDLCPVLELSAGCELSRGLDVVSSDEKTGPDWCKLHFYVCFSVSYKTEIVLLWTYVCMVASN